ncbi:MAG: undecaprenyl diphosphate synthase family protein [Actinomycetota bacterium]|nr:undecaprenyl diphosphate synthase family protein [Actinomycetota bacterium]MDA3010980.1 undecaprenyl diphosphate synthase family protein [Actinomycetota bacterium]MDA3024047.1 undecaprenyl diphosphate synthase family protein [Actinomycetota bacterium]
MALESSLPAAIRRGMRRIARRATGEGRSRSIHVVVCGGSIDEWNRRTTDEWNLWAAGIGESASRQAVTSVTVYPLSGSDSRPVEVRRWSVAGVAVTAWPQVDGRQRLADVVDAWPSGLAMTEETLGRALVGPGDIDVVAVIGAPGRLPSALVWELAYAELIDVDVEWEAFTGEDLTSVIEEFRTRHRRFGGLHVDETT